MSQAALGRTYQDQEIIVRQGEVGDCMYIVEDGEVEVVVEADGGETLIRTAGRNEVLGEMAIFERKPRSATVRSRGQSRVLTLDKRNFLRRISEDPSVGFRVIETLCRRVRDLTNEVVELRARQGDH